MRFRQYMNEGVRFKDREISKATKKLMYHDCKQYLDDAYKIGEYNFLFRGMTSHQGDFFRREPRKDRKPLDSSERWHQTLDIYSKEKFGVKMRSEGVFCKLTTPTGYGLDYIVLPFDGYYCLWHPNVSDAYFMEPDEDPQNPDYYDKIAEKMVSGYQKGSLKDAVKKSGGKKKEVILICKKYYGLKVDYYNQLVDWNRNIHEIK